MAGVSILVICITSCAILVLLSRQDSSSLHYLLHAGEMVSIDFGFPAESGYDFKAQSDVVLANNGDKPIQIEKVNKSCSCQTLVLEPKDIILPGQDLHVRFVHSDATNGKGGYFFDRILLRISV